MTAAAAPRPALPAGRAGDAPRGWGGQRGLGGRQRGAGGAVGAEGPRARSAARGRDGGARGRGGCRLPPALPFLPPSLPTAGLSPPPSPAAPRRGVPGLPSPEAPPLSPRGISRARNHPASPRAVVPPGRPSFSPRPPAPSPGSLLHPPGKPAGSCPFPTCRAAPRPGCGAGSAPRLPRARGGSSELEVGKRCKGGRLLDCQPRSQLGENKFVSLSLHTYMF